MNKIIDVYAQEYLERANKKFKGLNPDMIDSNLPSVVDMSVFGDYDITLNIHYSFFNKGPIHRHDYFEMIYVYKGKCLNQIYNKGKMTENTLHTGDICILNPNVVHALSIEEDGSNIIFNIMFKRSLFEKVFINVISENNILANFFVNSLYTKKDEQSFLVFKHNSSSMWDEALDKLIIEFIQKKLGYDSTMNAYMIILFLELIRYYGETLPSDEAANFTPTNINEILEYIRENYNQVTLKSAAEYFHYNPAYLSTYIKKYTNETFSDIVLKIKLGKFCSYLEKTDLPTSEIMNITGFNYGSHFFKLFKKHMKVSPAEYRAFHRKQA